MHFSIQINVLFFLRNVFMSVWLLLRQTHSPRWIGARGLFSRGGGGAGEEQQTLEDVAKNIRERQFKRVVVMAGAGISTPSGIPDFRYKVRYDFINVCYELSGASWGSVSTSSPLTGLQAAVSMTTCSSTTCRTPRPYSRSAFSVTTLIRSSPWPKSCTRGTISPTWLIILCDCCTRRSSCSGCTRRTSTGWKDVCVLYLLASFGSLSKMLLSSYFIFCVCGKWQEFLLRCWWRLTVHLPRPPAPSAGGTTRERSCEWVYIWMCKYFKYHKFNCWTRDVSHQGRRSQSV